MHIRKSKFAGLTHSGLEIFFVGQRSKSSAYSCGRRSSCSEPCQVAQIPCKPLQPFRVLNFWRRNNHTQSCQYIWFHIQVWNVKRSGSQWQPGFFGICSRRLQYDNKITTRQRYMYGFTQTDFHIPFVKYVLYKICQTGTRPACTDLVTQPFCWNTKNQLSRNCHEKRKCTATNSSWFFCGEEVVHPQNHEHATNAEPAWFIG